MEQVYHVKIRALAYVETVVIVDAETESSAISEAIAALDDGDNEWRYDGLVDDTPVDIEFI